MYNFVSQKICLYCETAAKEIFMIGPVALIMLYSFSLQMMKIFIACG